MISNLKSRKGFYILTELTRILKTRAVQRAEKIKIYKSLIRPVITYGAKVWTLNKETTKRLALFERKVLPRILGANWRRRNNSALMNLHEDVDIVSFIRLSILRWIGHVNRMDKERKVYSIFFNQEEKK